MSEYELNDIRARQLAKYGELIGAFDHKFEDAKAPETGEVLLTEHGTPIRYPTDYFGYWLDHIYAAIDAGWFKHLTKEMADDMDSHQLLETFRQIDDEYTEQHKKAFIDPNS